MARSATSGPGEGSPDLGTGPTRTRIGPLEVEDDGVVVRFHQRRGTNELIGLLVLFVGGVGIVSLATNPVSVATWVLGPFIVLFVAVGILTLGLRLTGRDRVTVDRDRRRMSYAWITVPIPGALRVEATEGVLRRRRVWHVDLTSSEGALRVAGFVDKATAEQLVRQLQPVLAWPSRPPDQQE